MHVLLWMLFGFALLGHAAEVAVFNVKEYGATGTKPEDARPALQRAIDACAAAGGGTVLIPAGQYTSGTLRLRSHVRVRLETGATVFASPEPKDYAFGSIPSKAALFYGEDLEDVALEGPGTMDGQAEYEWRSDDFERTFDHKKLMQKLRKPLTRSFPKGFPERNILPHLIWLGRAKDVRLTGLQLVRSASWTVALYDCERVVCERLSIQSSLKEGVWADGVDLDGCRHVTVKDCAIATGDDCVVFIASDSWGPARPCEDITVTHCCLSSASAGVKFSEGNKAGIRNVRVNDTVLTNVNRGFVFSTTLGGDIREVTLSNLTIWCNRFDWFWSGDGQPFYFKSTRLNEFTQEPAQPGEAPPGRIQNVLIREVVAHAKGSSLFQGHPENWLDGLRLDNVTLSMMTDPTAPFDLAEQALRFRWARNLKLKNVQIVWEKPILAGWKSALQFEDVSGLELEGFTGQGAWPEKDTPAVVFNKVVEAVVRRCRAVEETTVFLRVLGLESRGIRLEENDLSRVRFPWQCGPEVKAGVVTVKTPGASKERK